MSKKLFSRPSAIARTLMVCVLATVAIGPVASPKSSRNCSRIPPSAYAHHRVIPERGSQVMTERSSGRRQQRGRWLAGQVLLDRGTQAIEQ